MELEETILDEVDYPTNMIPLADPQVLIFAKLLRIIRREPNWKINLQGIYLTMDGKDYLFPLSRIVIDSSEIWP
jgi:hypothetical protein